MTMKKKAAKPLDLKNLTRLVTWLDGFAAMSPVDPARLENAVKKNSGDHELASAWKEVQSDVWDIARVPSSSAQIKNLSKILGVLKQILMFVGLIVFTAFLITSSLGYLNSFGRYSYTIFITIFIVAYAAAFGSYFYLDKKLTRLVKAYYEKHSGEIATQRKHVKQVNQRVIDKLASGIRARKLDPQKYRFTLLHKDYSNISVVGQHNDSEYIAVIKGSSIARKPEKA
ncbi:MAG: hypothetical protein ACREBS_03700 [Nitrososphaerales archaeon]